MVPPTVSRDAVQLYFDGGCRGKLGSGGYLAMWHGVCLGGEGQWFGSDAPTNNVAEARAMLAGLRWVGSELGWALTLAGKLLVMGDSHLVI